MKAFYEPKLRFEFRIGLGSMKSVNPIVVTLGSWFIRFYYLSNGELSNTDYFLVLILSGTFSYF